VWELAGDESVNQRGVDVELIVVHLLGSRRDSLTGLYR
jgi:hypothetical protein